MNIKKAAKIFRISSPFFLFRIKHKNYNIFLDGHGENRAKGRKRERARERNGDE